MNKGRLISVPNEGSLSNKQEPLISREDPQDPLWILKSLHSIGEHSGSHHFGGIISPPRPQEICVLQPLSMFRRCGFQTCLRDPLSQGSTSNPLTPDPQIKEGPLYKLKQKDLPELASLLGELNLPG